MSGIFISYRRESTAAFAGRLYDRLSMKFGKERTFIDIDTIEPGEDFVEVLEHKLDAAIALIVLIGRDWVSCKDAQGRVRLENPDDFVRLEVATALRRKVRVIPVLMEDALMPSSQELPEDLALLARRQAIVISNARFHQDATKLVEVLEKLPIAARDSRHTYRTEHDDERESEALRESPQGVTQVSGSGSEPRKRSVNTWFWVTGTVVPIVVISIFVAQPRKQPTYPADNATASKAVPWPPTQVATAPIKPDPSVPAPSQPSALPKSTSRPMTVGGNIAAANLIHQVTPEYPPAARAARVSGVVKLDALIAKDGTIEKLQLLSGSPLLVNAAVDAVRQWRYQPTLVNGVPVELRTTIDVSFVLSQ